MREWLSGMRLGFELLYANGVLYVFAFAAGTLVGSFLNVVIYRWPRELSIVRPGSHCPACGRPIPWYWNVPLLSWVLLLGRCRWCRAPISARYVLVEILGGAWAALCLWRFGPTLPGLAAFAFGSALLAGSVIDLQFRLLPDAITVGMIPLGIGAALLPSSWMPGWSVSGLEAGAGAALGGGVFLLVLLLFKFATGREGMGQGDVKLMAGLGAVLGYAAIPAVIFIASAAGIAAWMLLALLKRADRDYPVPFGPFLSAGALAVLLTRPWLEKHWIIIHWVSIIKG
jgi:leader peptidase (prepilin peptidase)/N-methyltransferase